jgi:hypothetical protein
MPQLAAPDVTESESELVTRAQSAVSQCNWVVGECASKWTKKYARGRTDGDFGLLVGLSSDQVYQRRRVWETFADVAETYPALKWSHFYVALTWNDAPECLQWALENEATVSEMKAWRRSMHGEDAADENSGGDWGTSPVEYVSNDLRAVRDPDDFGEPGSGSPRDHASSFEPAATAAGFARASDGGSDLPPWEGADESQLPSDRGSTAPRDSHGPTTEQLVKRMAATLEKIERSISPEFAEAFHALPQKLRNRLIRAAEALQEKMADLGA